MPGLGDALIGIWSADARYGPGAQSDEMIFFKPDGIGRIEIINWALCTVVEFSWQVEQAGILLLNWGREHHISDDEKSVEVSDSDRGIETVAFSVVQEKTPSGTVMPVLNVKGLCWPSGPDKFGLVRNDVSGCEEFQFHLEK